MMQFTGQTLTPQPCHRMTMCWCDICDKKNIHKTFEKFHENYLSNSLAVFLQSFLVFPKYCTSEAIWDVVLWLLVCYCNIHGEGFMASFDINSCLH